MANRIKRRMTGSFPILSLSLLLPAIAIIATLLTLTIISCDLLWGGGGGGGGGSTPPPPSTAGKARIVLGEPTRPEDIGIRLLSGKGVAELQVGPNGSLSFDPDVIQLEEITAVGGFTLLASAIDNSAGRAIFAAVAFEEVSEGPIIEIKFRAVGTPGECTELTLSIDKLGDMEGERVPFEVISGRVCL